MAHLWDAAEAARLVRRFVDGRDKQSFSDDVLVRSAVERQFEVLGEALARLRRSEPETAHRIPALTDGIGMRNVIAHEYSVIDNEIVWSVATSRLGPLLDSAEERLEEAGPPPEVRDS